MNKTEFIFFISYMTIMVIFYVVLLFKTFPDFNFKCLFGHKYKKAKDGFREDTFNNNKREYLFICKRCGKMMFK